MKNEPKCPTCEKAEPGTCHHPQEKPEPAAPKATEPEPANQLLSPGKLV